MKHYSIDIFPNSITNECADHFISQLLYLEINGSSVKPLYIGDGFQDRNITMLEMVRCAFKEYPSHKILRCYIFTGDDRPTHYIAGRPLLSIAGTRDWKEFIIPDPYNWKWNQIGTSCFFTAVKNIRSSSYELPGIDKAVWRGRVDQCESRRICLKVMNSYPQYFDVADVDTLIDNKQFLSHSDHGKYKILLDFPGIGYSARVKSLAFLERCMVLYPRSYWDWATVSLEPQHHFAYPPPHCKKFVETCIELLDNEEMRSYYTSNMKYFIDNYITRNNVLTSIVRAINNVG